MKGLITINFWEVKNNDSHIKRHKKNLSGLL